MVLLRKKSRSRLDPVSTTCDSGWVQVEALDLLMFVSLIHYPPAIAGGTDSVPAKSQD